MRYRLIMVTEAPGFKRIFERSFRDAACVRLFRAIWLEAPVLVSLPSKATRQRRCAILTHIYAIVALVHCGATLAVPSCQQGFSQGKIDAYSLTWRQTYPPKSCQLPDGM